MNVTVDKGTVEQAVSQAIVASAIGDKIRSAVAAMLSKGYDNPIDIALKEVVAKVSLQLIRDEYTEQIRAAVRARLEETTMDAFVSQFWDVLLREKR